MSILSEGSSVTLQPNQDQAEEILSDLRQKDAEIRSFSLEQLPTVRDAAKPMQFIVEGLLAEGTVNLLSGGSNDGKSYFCLALADAVAHGKPFIRRVIAKRHVLLVDGENPSGVVRQRLDKLNIVESEFLKIWGGWNDPEPEGPESPLIFDFVGKYKPLVIFDSLIEFHTGSENDSAETRKFMRRFRKLAYLGATVVVLHHTGKGEGTKEYRGSADIKGAVDQAYLWAFIGEAQARGRGPWKLTPFKIRAFDAQELRLEFANGRYRETAEKGKTAREVLEELVKQNAGFSQTQLIELATAQGISKNRAVDALSQSASDGVILSVTGKRGAIHYRLADAQSSLPTSSFAM
jgi:AAA domain